MLISSIVTCPNCAGTSDEQMPMNAILLRYECRHCGTVLQRLKNETCIFCAYGSVKCPPVQDGRLCGG